MTLPSYWTNAVFIGVSLVLAGCLCFATLVVLLRLVRRRPLGPLAGVVLLCWGSAAFVGLGGEQFLQQFKQADATPPPKPSLGFPAELAQMVVLKQLRDPSSAVFGKTSVYGDRKLKGQSVVVACGSVNAKNGFGGYTGSQKFLVLKEGYKVFFDNAEDNSVFSALWNGLCAGEHK
jgi:hypothetical protein